MYKTFVKLWMDTDLEKLERRVNEASTNNDVKVTPFHHVLKGSVWHHFVDIIYRAHNFEDFVEQVKKDDNAEA